MSRKKKIKFWGMYHTDDPAQSDVLFTTKKAREEYIRETYEAGDDGVQRREIEVDGPLTKETVCQVYQMAMR